VFPEGTHEKILRACQIVVEERIARPSCSGDPALVRLKMGDLGVSPDGHRDHRPDRLGAPERLPRPPARVRGRKGVAAGRGDDADRRPNALRPPDGRCRRGRRFRRRHQPALSRDAAGPALRVVRTREGVRRACGVYILVFKGGLYFLADTTVNIDPTPAELAEIALLTARLARRFEVEPRVALLSFSNFGSVDHERSRKVAEAVRILHELEPTLMVDGEMQAQTALDPSSARRRSRSRRSRGSANVLVFPDLESGNLAYQLLTALGGAEAVGPILTGMRRPCTSCRRASTSRTSST
jgi:malate dehydrogenase (oxaloacetate-decarboxylating)(NADP+)